MFRKLEGLEDAEHPLLGPNRRGLRLAGMLQGGGRGGWLASGVHLIATLFVLSQYAELWLLRRDLSLALRNLSITMLSTVCVVKAWTFVGWQRDWTDVLDSISRVEREQRARRDGPRGRLVDQYIRYSRVVTYLYWALVAVTVLTVVLAPLAAYLSSPDFQEEIRRGDAPYPEIMSSWLPFDKTRPPGYWIYIIEHAVICVYGGGIVATYDANAVAIMTFFAGQLRLLRADCAAAFGEQRRPAGDARALQNIRDCHQQHLFLIKYSRMFDSLLSPVMFLYIIICSLMICCSAIQLTKAGTTRMEQVWITEYLLALVAQLFLYCWHGSRVLHTSMEVEDGVYSGAWCGRRASLRRAALLLGGALRRRVALTAGPFTTLTVPTFVAILKGSYSYYAILSQNEKE
ncbi:unnamed protein product [Plutella xylostella]|uniref:Odorant receptor n=1 Tax=Plutella xylostella TaxID=51655 RepID=A0A8S4EEW9_PLUXY|nr:unnamed protein product [Plutella xylostella]